MENKLSITNEEFAHAIMTIRPDHKSTKEFLQLITSPGPKEKHAEWQLVCDYIRAKKNIPHISRGWLKLAHRIFMENFVEIEKVIWAKISLDPAAESNLADVLELVNTAIDVRHEELNTRSKKERCENYMSKLNKP